MVRKPEQGAGPERLLREDLVLDHLVREGGSLMGLSDPLFDGPRDEERDDMYISAQLVLPAPPGGEGAGYFGRAWAAARDYWGFGDIRLDLY